MYIVLPTHVLKVRAASGVSGSSSPSCVLSLMVSCMGLASAFPISNAVAILRMRRGLPCNEHLFSSLRMFIANSLPSLPVFVQAHCISHVQFVSCLLHSKTFFVRFWSCHLKVIDVSSCFLLDVFSKWFKSVEKNRRIVIVLPLWNSCELSHCACPTLLVHP